MATQALFIIFALALAVQRLLELRLSRRNEARILAAGGREHAPGQFRLMKVLHTSWFAAMAAEVTLLERPFIPLLAALALAVFLIGQVLRYAAIRTLDWRWTVRILTLSDAPPIETGIYRYIRHPNYLGVILEVAAAPLLHTAYLTSIVFTLANAGVLIARIRTEERALNAHNAYDRVFKDRPRFVPFRSRSGESARGS
ncbi:MAG TPA: isoprenylcysteine carboxylmethyltransferase family protein [Anaerolineae bacterium]|nr:isoprenylcysteine carboxylmethyltransferase family protein [Anaerolineae bacterium]